MLWVAPLAGEASVDYATDDDRYGFVDVNGKLVIPQRYDGYSYCPDAAGRTAFVIVSSVGHHDEVFDLRGKLVARMPTNSTDCGGADHVVITNVVDGEVSKYDSGLMDLTTGAMVVPIAKDRHIEVVDARTVNVSDPKGEYFLDLTTRRRTPHKGWLVVPVFVGDGKLLPAAAKPPGYDSADAKLGFIDRSGAWVVPAKLDDAKAFTNGYSVIRTGKHYTFLNAALQRTGGTWDDVSPIEAPQGDAVLGYRVTRAGQQGLLGPNLQVILPPGPVSITCAWEDCSVVAKDGSATLAVFPGGTLTPMPVGFTRALSPSFLADEVSWEDGSRTRRVYAIATGVSVELAAPTGCTGVGKAWAACGAGAGMAPPVVIDTSGHVTGFATAEVVADPSPDAGVAYYWVTAGSYQGFVDDHGTWRFRQSRFIQLED